MIGSWHLFDLRWDGTVPILSIPFPSIRNGISKLNTQETFGMRKTTTVQIATNDIHISARRKSDGGQPLTKMQFVHAGQCAIVSQHGSKYLASELEMTR